MINKWLIIASAVIMFFSCENGTSSNDNDPNSIIDISSLGIDTHQDNGYYSDADTNQYEFDVWKSGVNGHFQCAIFYVSDPSISIPEDGTYNIDNTMDSEGDFSFYYFTSQEDYYGTSGSITISNSDIGNGTYTFTANNVHTTIADNDNNLIGTATFIGTINVTE